MAEIKYLQGNQQFTQQSGVVVERIRVAGYCRVSTDTEEQKNSYESQIRYYTDLIKQNRNWIFSGIYADEATTGTSSKKRDEFMRMINDCMDGKVDMIVTKSISRFARNTLDTLKYVRMLKEKNVAVIFENENINTLTMDGELLLVILSAVAQQEVENTSANVKRGLAAKMKRGEVVGFPYCYGYNYDPKTKKISINEEEAETVRYIFKRYIEGYGSYRIAKELTKLGIKTRLGKDRWHDSAIKTIIKNEKYVGDMLLGKTVTLDPIDKKRVINHGEYDRYYIKDHHRAIISRKDFEAAQELYNRRSLVDGKCNRTKYTKLYPFSNKITCGFCGKTISRRIMNAQTRNQQIGWTCSNMTKNGKKYCPHSHYHNQELIENAFVDAYKMICAHKTDAINELITRMETVLRSEDYTLRKKQLRKEIKALSEKRQVAYDLRIEEQIAHEDFQRKYSKLTNEIDKRSKELHQLEDKETYQDNAKHRVNGIKAALDRGDVLDQFDEKVFESIVSRIVIGETDSKGSSDPHKIIFYFKTGIPINGEDKAAAIAEIKKELRLDDNNAEAFEIIRFKHYCEFFEFVYDHEGSRQKNFVKQVNVSVRFDVDMSEGRHVAR